MILLVRRRRPGLAVRAHLPHLERVRVLGRRTHRARPPAARRSSRAIVACVTSGFSTPGVRTGSATTAGTARGALEHAARARRRRARSPPRREAGTSSLTTTLRSRRAQPQDALADASARAHRERPDAVRDPRITDHVGLHREREHRPRTPRRSAPSRLRARGRRAPRDPTRSRAAHRARRARRRAPCSSTRPPSAACPCATRSGPTLPSP